MDAGATTSGAPGDRLADDDGQELRIAHEIAAPQASRLLREPKEPLEADGGHPGRRALRLAGDEVESGADAQNDGWRHGLAYAMAPDLLLRGAEREEQQVRLRGADGVDRLALLGDVFGQVDVGGADADDPDSRILPLEDRLRFRADPRAAA